LEFCRLGEKRRQNSVSLRGCVDRAKSKSSEAQGLGRSPEVEEFCRLVFPLDADNTRVLLEIDGTRCVPYGAQRRRGGPVTRTWRAFARNKFSKSVTTLMEKLPDNDVKGRVVI
jgi:hypothetical protein